MNEKDIRLAIAAVTSAVTVGVAIRSIVRTTQQERAKRQMLQNNLYLDIQAIRAAEELVRKRIDRGEIRSLATLAQAINDEIAFQKIAVRES